MTSRRPLYGWLTAEAISLTGTRVSMVALPWFVLTTTGSATKTGLVALAEMLPLVILKVLGGPVIDRVGARRVAITCDLLSVLAVGSIPLLHEAGWLPETTGSAATVGLVFATFGGAAAIGSVCAAAWADRLPRYKTYLVAFLVCGAPRFVVFALDVPIWAVLAVCVAGGFASGFLNPILGAVIYERIPAPLMGRVTSLNTALCFALMPFGGILGGLLIAGLGLSSALLIVGAAYFVVTMLPAVDPHWREMDRRPVPAEPGRRDLSIRADAGRRPVAHDEAMTTAGTRVAAIVIGVVDVALLVLSGVLALWTYVEVRKPEADPLTGIGYLVAAALATLAGTSLSIAWASTVVRGRWRVALLVLAALPLLPVALYCLATW